MSADLVLRGYGYIPSAPGCRCCGANHYAVHDDGNAETVKVECWCGASARCPWDDPDLRAYLGESS